jgi:hypothetical protein
MAEKRILKKDFYGLRGYHVRGGCVDHLVAGTVFELKENEAGEQCLHAYGREYPLDSATLHDAMERSEPHRGS